MADPIPAKPFVFDTAKVTEKLTNLKAHLNGFVGKPGYNPFAYLAAKVNPLIKRIEEGEKTEALQTAVLSLEDKPEPLAKGAEYNAKAPPKQAQAAGATDTRGIAESSRPAVLTQIN